MMQASAFKKPSVITLAATAFCLATAINLRVLPLSIFYAEWWTGIAFVVLLLDYARTSTSVRLGLGCLAFGLIGLLSLGWLIAENANASYPLYAAMAMAAALLASSWRSIQRFKFCAMALLACAAIQAILGLWQFMDWPSAGLVATNTTGRVFGNLNQANHYADLLSLGLASAAYLFSRNKLRAKIFIALSTLLSLASVPSGSRTSLLYIVLFVIVGAICCCKGRGWRGRSVLRFGAGLLTAAAIATFAQLTFPVLAETLNQNANNSTLLRADGQTANTQRLYNWSVALNAIKIHPWAGTGPDSFMSAAMAAMPALPASTNSRFAEHAHNLPLNLAVEFGLPATLAICAIGLLWLLYQLRGPASGGQMWVLVCTSVLVTHSLLEYPLWYAHFLLPFAIFVGLGDARRPIAEIAVPTQISKMAALLALLALAWIWSDWQAMCWIAFRLDQEEPYVSQETRQAVQKELRSISHDSVFSAYADRFRLQAWRPEDGHVSSQADLCEANWTHKPASIAMMRCAEAYAHDRREKALDTILQAFCEGFPDKRIELKSWAQVIDREAAPDALKLAGRRCF